MQTSRIRLFDTLKGLCVVFVIISHYSWSDDERLMALLPFWVGISVPVFMIISGYVLSGSFEKHRVLCLEDAYRLKTVLPKLIRYTVPFSIAYLIELCDQIIKGAFPGVSGCVYLFLQGGYGPGGYYYPALLQLVFVFPVIYFVIKKSAQAGIVVVCPCQCGI